MTARCVQCGQENNPQYRFCGMCGAPLGAPPVAVRTDGGRDRSRAPVSGPSFLGLGDERTGDLDYLLEDDPNPPRGHGRLYFALLLLAVSAGVLAWQWQRDGYPWAGYVFKSTANKTAASPVPPPPDPAPTAAPAPAEPTANPAPPESQSKAGEAISADPSSTAPDAANAAGGKAGDQAIPATEATSGEAVGKLPAASPQAPPETAANETRKQMRPETATPTTAGPAAVKTVGPKPAPSVPPDTFEDKLVADGERYLYGRGVAPDCARAQRNLQIAARQSNPRAQTMLGAMYATGHCVGRDLPSAYRWFAQALHGDPGNSRVQRDLEVLWKQMTPEERQLAMRNQ